MDFGKVADAVERTLKDVVGEIKDNAGEVRDCFVNNRIISATELPAIAGLDTQRDSAYRLFYNKVATHTFNAAHWTYIRVAPGKAKAKHVDRLKSGDDLDMQVIDDLSHPPSAEGRDVKEIEQILKDQLRVKYHNKLRALAGSPAKLAKYHAKYDAPLCDAMAETLARRWQEAWDQLVAVWQSKYRGAPKKRPDPVKVMGSSIAKKYSVAKGYATDPKGPDWAMAATSVAGEWLRKAKQDGSGKDFAKLFLQHGESLIDQRIDAKMKKWETTQGRDKVLATGRRIKAQRRTAQIEAASTLISSVFCYRIQYTVVQVDAVDVARRLTKLRQAAEAEYSRAFDEATKTTLARRREMAEVLAEQAKGAKREHATGAKVITDEEHALMRAEAAMQARLNDEAAKAGRDAVGQTQIAKKTYDENMAAIAKMEEYLNGLCEKLYIGKFMFLPVAGHLGMTTGVRQRNTNLSVKFSLQLDPAGSITVSLDWLESSKLPKIKDTYPDSATLTFYPDGHYDAGGGKMGLRFSSVVEHIGG